MKFNDFSEVIALEKKVEETTEWRHRPENVYVQDGLSLVSKVDAAGRDLKASIKKSVDLIGGFRRSLSPGDRVLLKANFNSADPLPAATDLDFFVATVQLLQAEGITDLAVGDRSGWPALPTHGVMEKLGILSAARELGVRALPFDDGLWMDVKMGPESRWWDKVTMPQTLKEFDRIVYLCCLKTHRLAGFTGSLKLSVGLTHTAEMPHLHADFRLGRVQEPMYLKMLELCLPVGPDLILMDARRAFVTGGPVSGEMVEPGIIMASGDRIAIDVEGVKILQQYPRDNHVQMPVWEMPLIRRAVELGLGASSEAEYRVV